MTIITRTNRCTNPSIESATTGWVADFSTVTPTLTQVPNPWPGGGTKSLKVTFHGDDAAGAGVKIPFTTVVSTVYTASVWIFAPSGSPQMNMQPSGGVYHGYQTLFDQWQRVSVTFTATGTTTTIFCSANSKDTAGSFWYLDAVLFETGSTLMPFFDGNSPTAVWTGTANLSTSTLSFDDAPAVPQTVVEFDALAPQPTEFLLDNSLLDGPLNLTVTPRWATVDAALVQEIDITRGKSDPNSQVQAGECTIRCDNWSGDFDPDNPHSIYNQAGGDPYLQPGMLCRVSSLYPAGGVFAPELLMVGRLETAALDKGLQPSATLTFIDDMGLLGQTQVGSFDDPIRSGEMTAQRAAWALSQASGLYGAVDISANLQLALLPTYGGDTVLDELNMVATAEAGRVYVDRAGNVIATAHADEFTQQVVAALDDGSVNPGGVGYVDIGTSSGLMQVINQAQVDRYSRSDTIYQSMVGAVLESITRYGQKSLPPVVASLLNDSDAQALATYLATRRSRPRPLVDSVTVELAGNREAGPLLTADMATQITVSRRLYQPTPRTDTLRLTVEGMRWTITTGSHRITMITAPIDATALGGSIGGFIIDGSLLDSGDVLTP